MRKLFSPKRLIGCFWLVALTSLAFGQATFKTSSFTVRVKMNDDRTATVDETIDLAFEQGNTGGISNLVVAESAAGRPSEYSILKETLVVGQETIPILVKPTSRGSIVASLPASALQNVTSAQLHVAYRVKGAFVDRIGGDLGARSTFTWDVIPATWPTDIASSSIELENAPGIAPLYIGGITAMGGVRAVVEKRGEAAFTGSTTRLRADEVSTGVIISPAESIPPETGFRLLVALPSADLKQAPDKLPQVPTAPIQSNIKPPSSKCSPTRHVVNSAGRQSEDWTY